MCSFPSDAPTLEGSERLRMRFAIRQTFRNVGSKYVSGSWIFMQILMFLNINKEMKLSCLIHYIIPPYFYISTFIYYINYIYIDISTFLQY